MSIASDSPENCLIVCSQSLEGVPGHVAAAIEDSFVIAVDGGLSHFKKIKLKPALWVGDGDSASKTDLKKLKCRKVKLPRAKDYSDLEYALHLAGKAFLEGEWEGDIVLLGAQGGRFDHDIGALLSVQHWMEDMARATGVARCPGVVSYGPHGMWLAVMNEVAFHQPKGAPFSVLALGRGPRLTISGARYKLKAGALDHASMGLSNEGLGKTVLVRAHQTANPVPVFVLFPTE
ncbi:MAG: thiamine diphosphokinase [Deltaproteobacteria bacterium]|nr:thiamine diphosphokinase [Deltaproteobacteria bacterium]